MQVGLLFQPAEHHLGILSPGHLLSDHSHLDIHLLLGVFALVLGRLSLYLVVAFPRLFSDHHDILAVEGNSGLVADSLHLLHSVVDSRSLSHPHSYLDTHRCTPAHTHYRSPGTHDFLEDTDRNPAANIVVAAVEAGYSLAEDQVSEQHAHCTVGQEVDSNPDRKPLS